MGAWGAELEERLSRLDKPGPSGAGAAAAEPAALDAAVEAQLVRGGLKDAGDGCPALLPSSAAGAGAEEEEAGGERRVLGFGEEDNAVWE